MRKWTAEDDDYLRGNYCDLGVDHCAEALNRTRGAVMARAAQIGCRRLHPWTAAEEDIIRAHYRDLGATGLTGMLRRSPQAIHARAASLGISNHSFSRPDRRKRKVTLAVSVDAEVFSFFHGRNKSARVNAALRHWMEMVKERKRNPGSP